MKNKYAELLANISNEPKHPDESILLIDGLNAFLRSFTAINTHNPNGHHIGGLTGFLKSIGYASKMFSPTRLIITFDGPGSAHVKRNLNPMYKSNRNPTKITNSKIFISKEEENESINNQMGRLMDYIRCLPINIITIDGVEADDVIGYLTMFYEQNENTKEISIMSSDKDFLQLVSSKTSVYSPTKKKIYKPKDVIEEYGVSSINFINYKILLGDSSDNLRGVPGLGPKKLIKALPELSGDNFINLNELFSNLEKLSNKNPKNQLYKNILENKNQIELNNRLMNLKNVFLSPENEEIVKNLLTIKHKFDKQKFITMYNLDLLGESIPNLDQWLGKSFEDLTYY